MIFYDLLLYIDMIYFMILFNTYLIQSLWPIHGGFFISRMVIDELLAIDVC